MKDEIFIVLAEGFVQELKKPSIDRFERAIIIRRLLDEQQISIREFSRKYGFSKSTVEDWLLYNKITEAEYNGLVQKGVKPTDIYRGLRDHKTSSSPKCELDFLLDKTSREISKYVNNNSLSYSDSTKSLAYELIESINKLIVRIERKK